MMTSFGGVPEWLKGLDCKSGGYAFEGSNPSSTTKFLKNEFRGCSSMVELQPSKLIVWVRFPSPAPFSAHIAQLVERVLGKDEVTSSIPVMSTIPLPV